MKRMYTFKCFINSGSRMILIVKKLKPLKFTVLKDSYSTKYVSQKLRVIAKHEQNFVNEAYKMYVLNKTSTKTSSHPYEIFQQNSIRYLQNYGTFFYKFLEGF